MGAALHEAALAHPLLPQQHHLGVHPPPAHPRAAAAAGRGRSGRGGTGTGKWTDRKLDRRAGSAQRGAEARGGAGRGARAAWRPPSRRGPERRPHGEILRQPERPQGALGPGVRRLLAALPQPLQVRRGSGSPRPPAPFRQPGPTWIGATPYPQASPFPGGPAGSSLPGWVSCTINAQRAFGSSLP